MVTKMVLEKEATCLSALGVTILCLTTRRGLGRATTAQRDMSPFNSVCFR